MKPDKPVARRGDYTFNTCDRAVARSMIEREHYTKSVSKAATFVCAVDKNNNVVAVAALVPPSRQSAKKYARTTPANVIGIHRLVVEPDQPQNVATMLIGAVLRNLKIAGKYDTVVSYADTAQGHTGAIYRATNAEYLGMGRPDTYWVDADGKHVSRKAGDKTRTVRDMRRLGYTSRKSPGKHIFRWTLD